MSPRFRVVQSITMKRRHVNLNKGSEDKYGHWWFEIGDPNDPQSESYGWWPERPVVGLLVKVVETFGGIQGELNGLTS
jgi:hypothetical protein